MNVAIVWGGLAAGALLVGMVLAYTGVISLRWTGLVMAFGAGALISAVAYQLVLPAIVDRSGLQVGIAILAGAMTFYLADRAVDRMGGKDRGDFEGKQASGSGLAIFLGAMLDGIPESLVLGLSVAHATGISTAFVFAVLISNIPEGLGGTSGMLAAGWQRARITQLWVLVVVLSVVAAVIGYVIGTGNPAVTGGIVDSFAAGALLVMLTDSMIPESFEYGKREAGLALVIGFGVAFGIAIAQV